MAYHHDTLIEHYLLWKKDRHEEVVVNCDFENNDVLSSIIPSYKGACSFRLTFENDRCVLDSGGKITRVHPIDIEVLIETEEIHVSGLTSQMIEDSHKMTIETHPDRSVLWNNPVSTLTM